MSRAVSANKNYGIFGDNMTKIKNTFNYRLIKKYLSKYFHFSFRAKPNKDFTPQQKSAITRKYLKIIPYIDNNFNPNTEEVTFLKYPKGSRLPGVDGVRVDTGLFYKWPQAKLARSKKEKNKWLVVVNPKIKRGQQLIQKRRDVFFPFPKSIRDDILKIKRYVDVLVEKYRPHSIMWSALDKRERVMYDPELFDLYFSNAFVNESEKEVEDELDEEGLDFIERTDVWKRRKMRKKHEDMPDYYNGVFFVYFLNQ